MQDTTVVNLQRFPMKRDHPLDPPADYGTLRAAAPVAPVQLWDGRRAWLITRYEDVRTILLDTRFSAATTHPGFPTVSATRTAVDKKERAFLRKDPPEHDVLRRMVTKDFMVKRIEAMRPRIQEIVHGLVDQLAEAGPPLDLHQRFSLALPSIVICQMLGVPYADHDFFESRSYTRLSATVSEAQALIADRELREYLDDLIRRREGEDSPGEDMIGRLIVEQFRTGGLSHDDLVTMARLMIGAGHETTANMISLGVIALLEHPLQLDRLKAEPTLAVNAVEELLRYLSIVHHTPRRVALEDVEFGGQYIRAGEGVFMLIASANRDETAFPDADRLDITRPARHHLAFGFGVHQCIGQPLARVELQVVFSILFDRVPTLRLAVPFGDLRLKEYAAIYGVHALPVVW